MIAPPYQIDEIVQVDFRRLGITFFAQFIGNDDGNPLRPVFQYLNPPAGFVTNPGEVMYIIRLATAAPTKRTVVN